MSWIACTRIARLASGEPSRLSDGERLRIEEHRAGCARCRDNAAFDAALRRLAERGGESPSAARIERAIGAALASRPRPPVRRPRRLAWGLGLGVGLAAAAAVAVVVLAPGDRAPLAIEVASPPDPATAPAAPQTLAAGEHRALAHATVTATRQARYRWRPGPRRVELERGALAVSVTPHTGKSFSVATPRFVVVVVGTEFDVDLHGVAVRRGVVKVLSPSGEVLAAGLVAGESWSLESAAAEPAEPEPTLEIEEDLSGATAARWLTSASRHIRAQDFGAARRSIRRALAAHPLRPQRAEAETRLAELALVSGDVAEAVRRYERVARRFAGLSQGESALFAAARLEAKRGHRDRARSLLVRYRKRYPRGRFSREVARKLADLGAAP